jgi:hypothetical protein
MQAAYPNAESRPVLARLGRRQGWLTGLALALGAWGLHAVVLSRSHAQDVYAPLLLGLAALLLVGGLAGWVVALRNSTLWGGVIWLLAAIAMTWILGHVAYEGRSLLAWLAEPRFWGLPIYPYSPAARARLLMLGFFVVLFLTVLGFLQSYRLEGIVAETEEDGRLSGRAWFLLLVPLPFLVGLGLIADNLLHQPERMAYRLVHEAIRTGRTYSGDLFELSLERGVNYNAIAGVRDQMSAGYTLSTVEVVLGRTNALVIGADFDNGAWIHCRVIADQLSHCYDASLPYVQGFSALLTQGQTPPDCRACTMRLTEEQRAWIAARAGRWDGAPAITRQAQAGSTVLMEAQSPSEQPAVECRFRGASPVVLDQCWDVERQD